MKYKAIIETDEFKDFEFFEDGNGKYIHGIDAGAVNNEWIPLYFTECKQESVLEKIKTEIEQLPITDTSIKLVEAIIDKYKAEGKGMTREEAIRELSYIADEMPSMECGDWKEAIYIAIKALEQEPKSVIYSGDGYADGYMVYDMVECPSCGYEYEEDDKDWKEPFCPHCGQPLNWEV